MKTIQQKYTESLTTIMKYHNRILNLESMLGGRPLVERYEDALEVVRRQAVRIQELESLLVEANDMLENPQLLQLARLIRVVRSGDFVILGTETTGLGVSAEICQIAIIDATGKMLLDTLVKPVRGIPADATRIHGITSDMVKDARGWLNVNEQVWQLVHGRDVIVYNADYDFRLLAQSEESCEPFALSEWNTISRVCAMNAYAEYVGDWNEYHGNYRWHKLVDAARAAAFQLPAGVKPHSAAADCLMTLAVCRFLAGVDQQSHIDANEPL